MAQEIDFSPREILNYLKDFERKLPLRTSHVYTPLTDCDLSTDEELSQEAQNMYFYLGMCDYIPCCSFANLPNNVGGETVLNGSKNVVIRISERYRNNVKPIRAILAHEVCHKYLQIHNIYYPNITKLNEVYTDLCTLYVGFGDLIVEGYNTIIKIDRNSIRNILGYITPDVYLSTYSIVSVIYAHREITHHSNREIFLNEALNIWLGNINKSKREILMEQFASFENYEALLTRNSQYLLDILDQVRDEVKIKFEYANEIFFDNNLFNSDDGEPTRPIHLFSAIYESVVDNSGKEESTDKIVAINNIIEETIIKIIDICDDINVERLPKIKYYCPLCGAKSNEHKLAGRSATFKCLNCNKYFRLNREEINIVRRRRIMNETENRIIEAKTKLEINKLKQEIEAEKKYMAESHNKEYDKAFNQGVFFEKERANKHFNKRIDELKNNLPLWAFLMPRKLLEKLKIKK